MILRSFVLRLSRILTSCASICLLIMGLTLFITLQPTPAWTCLAISLVALIANLVLRSIVNRKDPELIKEVAVWLYPAGALLCIVMGITFGLMLQDLVNKPGLQMGTPILAGVLVAIVLGVRALDIPWLRTELEIRISMQQAVDAPERRKAQYEPDKVY